MNRDNAYLCRSDGCFRPACKNSEHGLCRDCEFSDAWSELGSALREAFHLDAILRWLNSRGHKGGAEEADMTWREFIKKVAHKLRVAEPQRGAAEKVFTALTSKDAKPEPKATIHCEDGVLKSACPHCGVKFDLAELPPYHIDVREVVRPLLLLCDITGRTFVMELERKKPVCPPNIDTTQGRQPPKPEVTPNIEVREDVQPECGAALPGVVPASVWRCMRRPGHSGTHHAKHGVNELAWSRETDFRTEPSE